MHRPGQRGQLGGGSERAHSSPWPATATTEPVQMEPTGLCRMPCHLQRASIRAQSSSSATTGWERRLGLDPLARCCHAAFLAYICQHCQLFLQPAPRATACTLQLMMLHLSRLLAGEDSRACTDQAQGGHQDPEQAQDQANGYGRERSAQVSRVCCGPGGSTHAAAFVAWPPVVPFVVLASSCTGATPGGGARSGQPWLSQGSCWRGLRDHCLSSLYEQAGTW